VIPNEVGTAPGFQVRIGQADACFLPGVPREMKAMFDEAVLPRFASRVRRDTFQLRFRTFGLPESTLGERLHGVEEAFPGVIIGYRAHFPEVEVKVLAKAADLSAAQALAERAAVEVKGRLGDHVYGTGEDSYSGVVLRELIARQQRVAVAESCTGGLLSSALTAHPGASAAMLGGVVAYANSAKVRLLEVDAAAIEKHGAVSEVVAQAMAENVRRILGADVGAAITGIAGPDGGTEEKPVGTVFVAVATRLGSRVERLSFPWHRAFVQQISAHAGLKMIREASAALAAAPRTSAS
jgi:nicotinamide-nucleotide amidase